jgi:hypothetical protein
LARTYKTLSLSLPPAAVKALAARGKDRGMVAARVAAEIVLRDVAAERQPRDETRRSSWCCAARVIPVQGQLVLPETDDGERRWAPVIVLLCSACSKQMHGREYEGWIADVITQRSYACSIS